jgi:hypothetical protein
VQVALLSNNPDLIAFMPHVELTSWQNIKSAGLLPSRISIFLPQFRTT